MPPPSNLTALTAIDLGTLPANVVQNVHDAGTTYTVWYKFTAPLGKVVIGAWGFGGLAAYAPTTKPYVGPASAPVQLLAIAGLNVPIFFPVVPGNEYFLEFVTNGGNPSPASLTVNVLAAPSETFVTGDVMVAQADIGFPAIIYTGIDYTTRKLVKDFPVSNEGSQACILNNGAILINNDADKTVRFMSSSFVQLSSQTYGASGTAASIAIRGNRTVNKFYWTKDVNPVIVRIFDSTGVLSGTIHTLTAINNCRALCVNNDETILYHSGTPLGAAVRRWNLVTSSAMSDLVAGVANHFTDDILILPNGNLLVAYGDGIADSMFVRQYDASGATIATYNFNDIALDAIIRIAYPITTELATHFWVWGHELLSGRSRSVFIKVRISDGARVVTFRGAEFEVGAYDYPPTASPLARFGNHNCCPMVILPITEGAITALGGIYFINPGKTNDTLFTNHNPEATTVVKIPDPFIKTGFLGD